MPRPEALLIAGLPGSGKAPRLLRLNVEGWTIFDDYQAKAHGNSPHFRAGRRYVELVKALRDGKKCAVADIKSCRPNDREEARNNLEEDVPGLELRGESSRTTQSNAPRIFADDRANMATRERDTGELSKKRRGSRVVRCRFHVVAADFMMRAPDEWYSSHAPVV